MLHRLGLPLLQTEGNLKRQHQNNLGSGPSRGNELVARLQQLHPKFSSPLDGMTLEAVVEKLVPDQIKAGVRVGVAGVHFRPLASVWLRWMATNQFIPAFVKSLQTGDNGHAAANERPAVGPAITPLRREYSIEASASAR